jgi:hypothetical protein
MTRKWLNSADVEVLNGAIGVSQAASSFAGGIKTCAAAATPEQLVLVSTPCKRVWIGPRLDAAGLPLNTKVVFVGETSAKTAYDQGPVPITPSNYEGMWFSIDDASKLWIRVAVNGEGVAYRIFV